MKTVITYGTFDLIHRGHINILKRAKALGDKLIVGVTAEQYDIDRGKLNVEESLEQRIENVRKTGLADTIIVENYEGQKVSDVQKYNVDIFVIGSDWLGKFDYLKEYCEVVYLERTKNISSTELRNEKHKNINIGVVGAGRIANRFIPESKFVSGCQITGVCSAHTETAKAFAEKHQLFFYTSKYDALLELVDAVYIAAPHQYHYELAQQALMHSKHVLCEKPIALTSKELESLYELADAHNCVITEGIKTAFAPGFIRLVEIAKSGIIGKIKDVEACFTKLADPKSREMQANAYGGSVNELSTYPLTAIVQLLGEPVNTQYFSYIENGIDLYTRIHLEYKHAMAIAKTGIGVKSEGSMVISGVKGYIYVPAPWWKTQEFEVRFENPADNSKYFHKFYGDGLRYELAEFMNLIRTGKKESWKHSRKTTMQVTKLIEDFHKQKQNKTIVCF
ncbi:MAG: Gfo/Idh/MocA family oxidoreductase [Bacteroidales bacterium]